MTVAPAINQAQPGLPANSIMYIRASRHYQARPLARRTTHSSVSIPTTVASHAQVFHNGSRLDSTVTGLPAASASASAPDRDFSDNTLPPDQRAIFASRSG